MGNTNCLSSRRDQSEEIIKQKRSHESYSTSTSKNNNSALSNNIPNNIPNHKNTESTYPSEPNITIYHPKTEYLENNCTNNDDENLSCSNSKIYEVILPEYSVGRRTMCVENS